MSSEDSVERLIREIREESPEKTAEVDRYIGTERFRKLASERKVEALSILKSALKDARQKSQD